MGWADRNNTTPKSKRRKPLIQTPGLIAVLSGDRTTLPGFSMCLPQINYPAGSLFAWLSAGGGGLAGGRNALIRRAIDGGARWVWILDDDHTFAPDVLIRLLLRDVDIVQPLVLTKRSPYVPMIWSLPEPITPEMTDDDLRRVSSISAGSDRIKIGPHGHGLIEVGHCGTSGMLLSMDVIDAMPDPWFEIGQANRETACEDTWFCLKARRLGFNVFCDLDTRISHLTTAAVWPVIDEHGLQAEILTDWSKTTVGKDQHVLAGELKRALGSS